MTNYELGNQTSPTVEVTKIRLRQGFGGRRKINRPFYLFWPVIFLITPDNCQRVTCMNFKINELKNEKTRISGGIAGNRVLGNLSGGEGQKGGFSDHPLPPPAGDSANAVYSISTFGAISIILLVRVQLFGFSSAIDKCCPPLAVGSLREQGIRLGGIPIFQFSIN